MIILNLKKDIIMVSSHTNLLLFKNINITSNKNNILRLYFNKIWTNIKFKCVINFKYINYNYLYHILIFIQLMYII